VIAKSRAARAGRFSATGKSHFANQCDLLGESEWGGYKVQICTQLGYVTASPHAIANLRTVVRPEFMRYMDRECDAGVE